MSEPYYQLFSLISTCRHKGSLTREGLLLLLMPCGSRIVFLLTPLNPPTLPTKYILVGNQTSHHSICLAVKPTFTLLKSTSPSSVNAQLNVFMFDSHPKRVPIHSIIGQRGTYFTPEISSLRNVTSKVRSTQSLLVTHS